MHVVREDYANVAAVLEYPYCVVGVCSFNGLVARVLDCSDGVRRTSGSSSTMRTAGVFDLFPNASPFPRYGVRRATKSSFGNARLFPKGGGTSGRDVSFWAQNVTLVRRSGYFRSWGRSGHREFAAGHTLLSASAAATGNAPNP